MRKVLILGGGFAGLGVALNLSKNPNLEITLINKNSYHTYIPDLYEVSTAILEGDRRLDFKNLEGTVNIPLKKILGSRAQIIVGEVLGIDLPERTIRIDSGELEYDYLVLSLGSETNYFGVEGAKDYSYPLKTVDDAINIRNCIDELVRVCETPINVVIAGGGFTGTELAGSMAIFLQSLSKKYKQSFSTNKKQKGKVTILESSPTVLMGMPESFSKLALKRLKKNGVDIKLNSPISKVEEGTVYCGNKSYPYNILIWTTGVIGISLKKGIKGAILNKKNQIPVRSDLSMEAFPHVFVLGDMSEVIDEKSGKPVPATARAAESQAKVVAENINNLSMDKKTVKFISPSPEYVVPVGGMYAFSNFMGFTITGLPGWFLKRFIALKYLVSILPLPGAFSLWFNGIKVYMKNDS